MPPDTTCRLPRCSPPAVNFSSPPRLRRSAGWRSGFPTVLRGEPNGAKLKVGLVGCGGRGTGAAANALGADSNSELSCGGRRLFRSGRRRDQQPRQPIQGPDQRAGGSSVHRPRRLSGACWPAESMSCCSPPLPDFARATSPPPSTPENTFSAKNRWPSTRSACARSWSRSASRRKKD